MAQDLEPQIAVNHARGGPTYYVNENPTTFGERVAYVRSVDLNKTRLQLAEDTGLCERTVIHIETGEVTKLLLPSALAIAKALGVSLDWLCGRIEESGVEVDEVYHQFELLLTDRVDFRSLGTACGTSAMPSDLHGLHR